jgi:hypothetical protein
VTDPFDPFTGLLTLPSEGFVPAGLNGGHGDNEQPDGDGLQPPVTGPTCEMCGVEIPWAGKGRKPRFCQDHKVRTTPGTDRASRVKAPNKEADKVRLQTITDDLVEGAGKLAGTLAPWAPVSALTIGYQAPSAMAALVRIASDHPKFLDGLEKAAKVTPYIQVGQFLSALIFAVTVDMGLTNPYGFAGELLGVAKAARDAGWTPPQPAPHSTLDQTGGFVVPGVTVNPPPQFAMAR